MNAVLKADRPIKLAINQNVIIFFLAVLASGISEYYGLSITFYLALYASCLAGLSLCFTIPAYTYRQFMDKIKKVNK